MELRRVDLDYKELPDAYQIVARRGILTGVFRKHIDMRMAEKEYDKDELLNVDAVCNQKASLLKTISKLGMPTSEGIIGNIPVQTWNRQHDNPCIVSCEHEGEGGVAWEDPWWEHEDPRNRERAKDGPRGQEAPTYLSGDSGVREKEKG